MSELSIIYPDPVFTTNGTIEKKTGSTANLSESLSNFINSVSFLYNFNSIIPDICSYINEHFTSVVEHMNLNIPFIFQIFFTLYGY